MRRSAGRIYSTVCMFARGRIGDTYLLRIFGPDGKFFAKNRKRLK
jgi:hypothetical protein